MERDLAIGTLFERACNNQNILKLTNFELYSNSESIWDPTGCGNTSQTMAPTSSAQSTGVSCTGKPCAAGLCRSQYG